MNQYWLDTIYAVYTVQDNRVNRYVQERRKLGRMDFVRDKKCRHVRNFIITLYEEKNSFWQQYHIKKGIIFPLQVRHMVQYMAIK